MKIYLYFICWFMCCLEANADNGNNLIVYFNSGTKITLPVSEKPQITFEGNVLCVNTERYQFTDVKKYTFSKNEELSIEVIEADGKQLTKLDGEKLAVKTKGDKEALHVYSSKGIMQKVNQQMGSDGTVVLDIMGMPADVYIIKIGDKSFKFRKK